MNNENMNQFENSDMANQYANNYNNLNNQNNKNKVAEYEVKYEYVSRNLGNREVLNKVTIADKYKNEKCN